MGWKEITKGDKIAHAKGARFIKSGQKGTPGIEIAFEFEEPTTGQRETLNYVGWLSEKAINNTMDMLTNVLNSNGVEDTDVNGVFTSPGFIDTKKEVKLVVDMELGMEKDGVTPKKDKVTGEDVYYPRIKFVNNIGGSAYANVTPDVVKTELASLGFRAAFLASRTQNKAAAPAAEPTSIDPKDIPF